MPRALFNVHSVLQEFNPSKFIVIFSTFIFCILFSLRLDNRIAISYWLVFLPLWIWKSTALLGALIGSIIWLRNPDYRMSNSSYIHFKSMLISISLQILLLMFEILVCDKLESKRNTWTMTFIPLLFVSLLSISVCVWSVRNQRGFLLEFFAAINILQFALIPLKLDNFINWSWVVVFVPTWILLCFAVVVIIYAMIFAAIILRSPGIETDQRRASINSISSTSLIFLPMLMFVILLTSKLDTPPNVLSLSYFVTFLPLFVTLMILIRHLSFESRSGSLWWFGMRSDFCSFLLRIFPCLKEYGNTSFIMGHQVGDVSSNVSVQDSISNVSNVLGAHQTIRSSSDSAVGDSGGHHHHHHHYENNAKRLLHSLSQVFFRDKSHQYRDEEASNSPMVPKLNIDTPD